MSRDPRDRCPADRRRTGRNSRSGRAGRPRSHVGIGGPCRGRGGRRSRSSTLAARRRCGTGRRVVGRLDCPACAGGRGRARRSGVRLSGVRLSGVRLSGVRLSGVRLSGVRLSGGPRALRRAGSRPSGRRVLGTARRTTVRSGR
ncbi:pentapeptide repeat-containing protein [Cryptosporangium japonicum]|uniref:pentapeptide repeat-containing protein n=1 Tax=Cryptosporangium japonicum TaxID=80872 RepID=UPI003CD07EC2